VKDINETAAIRETEDAAPRHIAIIMDGNGRWAAKHGLPRSIGHRKGVEAVRRTVRAAIDLGIPYLTLYSFSSENWSRPAEEIADLMGLMKRFIRRDLAELHQAGVRIVVIGERTNVDPELMALIDEGCELTRENQVLTLEHNPCDAEALNSVFRGFHTIKGMAGFLDQDAIREVAHEVETILDLARNGALPITAAVIDRILESKDYLNRCLTELETMLQTGKPPAPAENAALIEAIRSLGTAPAPTTVVAPESKPAAAEGAQPLRACPPEPVTEGLIELARELSAAPAEPGPETDGAPADTAGLPAPENPEAVKITETKSAVARSIKVDTGKLDYLVDMVGEMVIAQSLVKHDPDLATGLKPRLARNLSQLARITDDVQRTAMSMRMIPVGQLFQKTGRLVRDLSRKYGKQVDLDLEGEDTELDRNIVEELADPLMHMVRNAIDHGIEMPEERVRAGKPATARLIPR